MTLKTLTALSLLSLAPMDAARAGEAAPLADPVLEIVTFRLAEGTDRDAFLAAARDTEAFLRETRQVSRRVLTEDATGLWTDVIEWRSLTAARRASEMLMARPEAVPFLQAVDPESVDLRYAPIHWRMD